MPITIDHTVRNFECDNCSTSSQGTFLPLGWASGLFGTGETSGPAAPEESMTLCATCLEQGPQSAAAAIAKRYPAPAPEASQEEV